MDTKIVTIVKLLDKNKAIAAFLAPVLIAALASAGSWIVTGAFDATEIRTAAGGVVAGAASAVGAYFAKPGRAEVPRQT